MINYHIDNGLDNNGDGHCDLCGRFVDDYGHHNAIKIFENIKLESDNKTLIKLATLDYLEQKLSQEDFVMEYFENLPYDATRNMTYPYWKLIYKYCENSDDPRSARGLNNFLRFNVVSKNVDFLEFWEIPLNMNSAINKFIVKKPFITYRGMALKKDNSFILDLEDAFQKLMKGKQKLYKFVDKGFVSTSRDLNYAKSFTNDPEADVKVLMSFISLKGSKAMPLSRKYGTTQKPEEKEVLFKFGCNYYICSIQKLIKNNTVFYNVIALNTEEDLDEY